MYESRIIIDMLCHDRWDDSLAKEMNPDKLLSLAHRNLVVAPLSRYVFDHKLDRHFTASPARRRMKESILLQERDKIVWLEALRSLVRAMEGEDIEVLLLKGLSYEMQSPRDMGDLDLLIRPDKLKQAIYLLEKKGYVYTGGERGFHKRKGEAGNWDRLILWSNQFEFLDRETGLLVELHTEFFHRDRVYRFNPEPLLDKIDGFWERSICSEALGCRILSVEDRLLLLSIHSAVKRSAPAGTFALRNILDIREFILFHKIDWTALLLRAKETEMLLFLIYSLEMVLRFFPDLPVDGILQMGNSCLTPFQNFFKGIMHSCYYDLETSCHSWVVQFRFLLPFAVKSRLKHILSSILILPVLFPEPWRLRQIYGLPHHSPWFFLTYPLEPIRWTRVLWRQRRPSPGKN